MYPGKVPCDLKTRKAQVLIVKQKSNFLFWIATPKYLVHETKFYFVSKFKFPNFQFVSLLCMITINSQLV